jgi:hypothetical protein
VRAAARRFFEVVACNVRRANEKGRVESGVGYVKKIFCVDCRSRCRSAISNMVGMRESMPVIEPEILFVRCIFLLLWRPSRGGGLGDGLSIKERSW